MGEKSVCDKVFRIKVKDRYPAIFGVYFKSLERSSANKKL